MKQANVDYLDHAARLATSSSLPHAVNPGLLLKGIGKISLPLSECDVKAIVNSSRQALFGESIEENINESELGHAALNIWRIQNLFWRLSQHSCILNL